MNSQHDTDETIVTRHIRYQAYAKRKRRDRTIELIQFNDGFLPAPKTHECQCKVCSDYRAFCEWLLAM